MGGRSILVAIAVAVVVVLGIGVAVAVTAGRALAPATTASAATSAAPESSWPTPKAVSWRACRAADLRDAQCASVAVPLDWSRPRGRTITLAIARVRHTAAPYAGVMLANPGGPGESGLSLATLGSHVPGGVGERYDWVGFDPRGVGDSRPRLTCQADYANGPRPRYAPPTDSTVSTWLARARRYASSCAKNGPILQHMTTADSARDIEFLRLALRAPKVSYYGYSYGTYLGQVYATLFPSHVARMVLDSNVDPRRVWYGSNLDQDAAFQTTMEAFFRWVAQHDAVYGLGTTPRAVEQAYASLAGRLSRSPAHGVLGPDELADTVLEAGYEQSWWQEIAGGLASALRQGDASRLVADWRSINSPDDDNGYAVYLAVDCTDAPWPADFATWRRDSSRVDAAASFETWPNTWFNAPCLTWPAKAKQPVRVDGSKAPAALLIDETLDAATPYRGSLEVRSRFPKARLLAEPGGTSHADSLSGNDCVDGAIARYLASGALPARKAGRTADATCPPLPVPSP
ncbi:alpha/beta hydrolase [Amnibacterium sp. CER49]|uniref:alpha/beta hydrolase n=1 Tax=Amnibacterium sp. CER49 TaxID=3039161 RepID=UPI00244BCB17|nr:alpha/beta hydrolase [Amnibacterium sp. CER49]MDH2444621.1 alpha/beta hydrolase [Amnibacterium sp. CER49]